MTISRPGDALFSDFSQIKAGFLLNKEPAVLETLKNKLFETNKGSIGRQGIGAYTTRTLGTLCGQKKVAWKVSRPGDALFIDFNLKKAGFLLNKVLAVLVRLTDKLYVANKGSNGRQGIGAYTTRTLGTLCGQKKVAWKVSRPGDALFSDYSIKKAGFLLNKEPAVLESLIDKLYEANKGSNGRQER